VSNTEKKSRSLTPSSKYHLIFTDQTKKHENSPSLVFTLARRDFEQPLNNLAVDVAVINGKHVQLSGTHFRQENITGGSHLGLN